MTNVKNSERATNAGFGNDNVTSPSAVDGEHQPMPGRTPEPPDSNMNTAPAVRTGQASAGEKPTEGDPDHDNPIHHTGHMPPPVTANRE